MKNLITIFLILLSLAAFSQNMEEGKQNLLKVDVEFSDYSEKYGMKAAFLEYYQEDGVLLRENSMPIEGIKSIKEYFNGFSDTTFILTWKPTKAEIAESLDMGFTYGIWTMKSKNNPEKEVKGTYVTMWMKQKDGQWKVVLDTGNPGIEKNNYYE